MSRTFDRLDDFFLSEGFKERVELWYSPEFQKNSSSQSRDSKNRSKDFGKPAPIKIPPRPLAFHLKMINFWPKWQDF